MEDLLKVGVITTTHGIRGEVKTSFSSRSYLSCPAFSHENILRT